mmetsp:Transcript_3385/g.6975  ORF Transcript_3385/g.6975 Transcript_3385/m.6975 type:complete len:356 (-) Transcript_3385:1374-2441(-)|eukprot:CAMPEP_0204905922 /NCGR_PEP_ID=MMETSP1397-20131031/5696_1 /ASSEMBLY_ACC=CAM_ASM_000891 /TAXON_ID=49980 /ORGANISM="Climacostomum Climacostomum virens, Strain Stock W-24" /LENGTH=355 /DNA_ID=CAMNT_0052074873 /DNA_START=1164 /DNA_END=2231 /DNA_ORIENTATION=+
MTLKLHEGALVDIKGKMWPLSDILGLSFQTRIGKSSSCTVVVKGKKRVAKNIIMILLHLAVYSLLALVGLFLSEYSVVLVALAGLYIFLNVIPGYLDAIDELAKVNVKSYKFEDPIDIVKLQKDLIGTPKGNLLIKRGLMFGEMGEKLLSVVLPSLLFDSIKLRKAVKFSVDVLYPFVVVLLPMVVGTFALASPLWKQMKYLSKKDFLVKYVLLIYQGFAGYLYFISPYTWMLTATSWVLNFDFDIFDIIDFVIGWLRSEVATLMMKVDYLLTKKMRLFKILVKAEKYIASTKIFSFFRRTYTVLEKPASQALKKLNTELIQQVSDSVNDIKETASKVKKEYQLLKDEEDSKKDN